MIPVERAAPFDHADWIFEAKFDGHVLRFGSEPKPGPKSGVFNS
jgi:hypothetical protein